MIANTYVVKPFGISEVKVIALKGEPGGPTQEQVNTAVEEYMDDHPEAQIPDGAVTTEKLASNTVAPYADNLVSSSYVSDSEPYLFRKTFAGVREDTEVVGGSVVWNQLIKDEWITSGATTYGLTITNNGDGTVTVNGTVTDKSSTTTPILVYIKNALGTSFFHCIKDHKYLYLAPKLPDGVSGYNVLSGSTATMGYKLSNGSAIFNCLQTADTYAYGRLELMQNGATFNNYKYYFRIFDLTLMFGSTIADYIYSLEQATAGAGVAWCKAYNPKMFSTYQPYNAGEIISVNASAHKMVGFNQWDEEWEVGGLNASGAVTAQTDRIRSKNLIPVIAGQTYYFKGSYYLWAYDSNGAFIDRLSYNGIGSTAGVVDRTVLIPSGVANIKFVVYTSYGTTYNNDICINISDPSRNGTYEPYTSITYPLSSTDLYGIPTIVDGKLKYDGDVYKSDGTVERRYGYRVYQSGDESLANAITDGTHTVYKLTTATTETTDPYTNPQKCYPDGTEEYIDTRDVPIPVGHNTKYMRDLKKLLEGIPDAPSANGTYVLKATVSASGVTYAWVEG